MKNGLFVNLLVAVSLTVLFLGCSTPPEPFEYEDGREVRKGPGVFSGDDGEFKVYTAGEKEKNGSAGKGDDGKAETPAPDQPQAVDESQTSPTDTPQP